MTKSFFDKEKFTSIEQEIIVLSIALKNIKNALAPELVEVYETQKGNRAFFRSTIHTKYFYMQILDFLSVVPGLSIADKKGSCLRLISFIGYNPCFNIDGSGIPLMESVDKFEKWLNKKYLIKLSFMQYMSGGVNNGVTLDLSNEEIINIVANISKHHFGRLTSVINKIEKNNIGNERNYNLSSSLDEIQDTLYNALYDKSYDVVENLMRIQEGIYEYLAPTYWTTYKNLKDRTYKYIYPSGVHSELAMSSWWDLMDFVGTKNGNK